MYIGLIWTTKVQKWNLESTQNHDIVSLLNITDVPL